MATSLDSHQIYCYQFCRYFWIGWIMSKKLHEPTLYFDNDQTVLMFPESWIDYVTIGFDNYSVMKKLRKRYEKLKNLYSKY